MTVERRSLLKGLVGAPLAMLLGGSVIADAATMEQREGSALVVPKRDLILANDPRDMTVFGNAAIRPGGWIEWNTSMVVPEDGELTIRLKMVGPTEIVSVMLGMDSGRAYVGLNGRGL